MKVRSEPMGLHRQVALAMPAPTAHSMTTSSYNKLQNRTTGPFTKMEIGPKTIDVVENGVDITISIHQVSQAPYTPPKNGTTAKDTLARQPVTPEDVRTEDQTEGYIVGRIGRQYGLVIEKGTKCAVTDTDLKQNNKACKKYTAAIRGTIMANCSERYTNKAYRRWNIRQEPGLP